MEASNALEDEGVPRKSSESLAVFTPDLKSQRLIYRLFGGLSLVCLCMGLWLLAGVAKGQANYAQPAVFLVLSLLVALIGARGLTVKIEITDSVINYRCLFGNDRFLISDVISILPISARGFEGIKISTRNRALVIYGYSMSKELLCTMTETVIRMAHHPIVAKTEDRSLTARDPSWLIGVTYSPFIIIWGGVLLALVINRARH